jgi:hypothetical protein
MVYIPSMNIFYLDEDVTECAKMHVDKHCVKMILEYAQLMSTAHRVLDGRCDTQIANGRKSTSWTFADDSNDMLYKATHVNHPSAVWARQSVYNYIRLYTLWIALMKEYTYRYGKHHACERLIDALGQLPINIQTNFFTKPPCCMPDECKTGDTIESYRKYYMMHKSHIFAWKNRPVPDWVK